VGRSPRLTWQRVGTRDVLAAVSSREAPPASAATLLETYKRPTSHPECEMEDCGLHDIESNYHVSYVSFVTRYMYIIGDIVAERGREHEEW
jgi:hypothetical protein